MVSRRIGLGMFGIVFRGVLCCYEGCSAIVAGG